MIDEPNGQHRGLPRPGVIIQMSGSDDPDSSANVRVSLLLIYMVGDFEIESIVWVGEGWITGRADQQFDLGRGP